MPFHMYWGESFLEIGAEFWPYEIAEIRLCAIQEYEDRARDAQLENNGILASILPFEYKGYGLALILCGDVWALEVASFPPRAEPGVRTRRARRMRERKERRQQRLREQQANDAAQPVVRSAPRGAKATKKNKQKRGKRKQDDVERSISSGLHTLVTVLYNIETAACEKFRELRRSVASFTEQTKLAMQASSLTMRQQLLRLITPSQEECRAANIAAWMQNVLPPGFQWERRVFFSDFMPMVFDTIGPKDTPFVRGGRSVFGEPAFELEFVS